MAFKIYTKGGDKGETGLLGGRRLPKNHIRIESYGSVDELNSWVGLIRDMIDFPKVEGVLEEVQNKLFVIGSELASDPSKEWDFAKIQDADVLLLEKEIDRMESDLQPLTNFLLPGGHPVVSHCHIARCVCRRAERNVVALDQTEDEVSPILLQYLNRLSDYFFVLSRWTGLKLGAEETPWKSS